MKLKSNTKIKTEYQDFIVKNAQKNYNPIFIVSHIFYVNK